MGVVSRLGVCYIRWVWSLIVVGVVSRLGGCYVRWVYGALFCVKITYWLRCMEFVDLIHVHPDNHISGCIT